MQLKTHGRYEYSAITKRPDFSWPEQKRLAVYVLLNLEHFAYGEGLGAKVSPGGGGEPDVLNYTWRDYGNRVGAWRLLQLFDELKLPSAVGLNTTMYDYCPDLLAAFRHRGDEIIAHGRTNSEKQTGLSEQQEKALIDEVTSAILKHEKVAPAGWLGPWLSNTDVTVDLLREFGYKYVLDWCHDNQPVWLKTRSGNILSVPFPEEINDIPAILVRGVTASDFADMIVDEFDEMLDQSQEQSLVCSISLHSYIVGQPFRLRHLRRALKHIASQRDKIWLTFPRQIATHFSNATTS